MDKNVENNETRLFLNEALREFEVTKDPDNKLRNLMKISQLVEVTTDDELYELASATALADDYRLRGEICYTISRSQKPQLVPFLRDMVKDENSYVRRAAITALNKIGGPGEATFSAINPILDEVEELKATLTRFEEKLNFLNKSIEKLAEAVEFSTRSQ
ncbi:HEAT repeat domain-containing protein, partial [Candidatus Poribacteria bacterium]|nr:HEAT repeat domain-containing protein [Candidatus Poribacteria bacterium]